MDAEKSQLNQISGVIKDKDFCAKERERGRIARKRVKDGGIKHFYTPPPPNMEIEASRLFELL